MSPDLNEDANSPSVDSTLEGKQNVAPSLVSLIPLFLSLGCTAFGGPAAHIAMMRKEFVERRKVLGEDEFLDLISACNLIPGPNSTELAIHLGYRFGGYRGLFISGLCFILPAFFMVLLLAYMYVGAALLPEVKVIFDGVKPVVVALVLDALLGLSRSVMKTKLQIFCVALAILLCYFVRNELFVLLLAGAVSLLYAWIDKQNLLRRQTKLTGITIFVLSLLMLVSFINPLTGSASSMNVAPSSIFFYFLKLGSVLYGSGYVLLAFLQADLVQNLHWISSQQLFDAISIGQITPGPVFTTATFIGFLLGGVSGAVLATVGIFAPAFIFVAITAPIFRQLRENEVFATLLKGVNLASLALMFFVLIQLFLVAASTAYGATVFAASFVLLRWAKVNVTILMLASAILSVLLKQFLYSR